MSRILLTGATGFIGSNLLSKLITLNHQVLQINSKDGDITQEKTWGNIPQTDIVIHLAAKISVPESWTKSYDYINCNLLGTLNALNYCKKYKAKLIFLSSYLYGNPDNLPINESATLRPTNPYALSKLLSEQLCDFYSKNHNIKTVIIRPFNIYGPGQSDKYLIQSIISQIKAGGIVTVKDLYPKRDYVYIDDVTNAIINSLNLNSNLEIFNIGSGESYSVQDVIDIVQELLKTNAKIDSSLERRKGEIMDTIADIAKAKQVLKWVPKTTFRQGLLNIINQG